MKFFKILLIAIIIPFSGLMAQDDNIVDLVRSFRTSYSLEQANNIMAELEKTGVVEDHVVFSEKDRRETVQMNVSYYVADYLYGKQQYVLSSDLASEALVYSRDVHDKDFEADILNLLAIANSRMGNYERAGYYAEQCYALDEESGEPDRVSSSLNTLAGIYVAAKRFDAAEAYVLKGLEACEKAGNSKRKGVLLGMASEVYHGKGNHELSLEYAQKAYDLETKLGREPQAMIRLSQRAAALLGLERYEEAESDLKKVIPYFEKTGNLQSLCISCNKLGRLLYSTGRLEEASGYYRQAAQLASTLNDPYNEMFARKGLYESLIETDSREARIQHDRYDALKDSLYNLATAESLSRYDASMENKQLQAETRRAQRAKYSILMLAILAVVVIATMVWLVMRNRIRRQRAAMESTIRTLRSEYIHLRDDYRNAVLSNKEEKTSHAEEVSEHKDASDAVPKPADDDSDRAVSRISKADQAFLDKLVSYVSENLDSGRLSVEDIASHMCLSSSQLGRKVKYITGLTTQNYVLRLRLEQAKILLQGEPDATVADIAFRCGFEDAASFSRAFKRTFNTTPSQLRS